MCWNILECNRRVNPLQATCRTKAHGAADGTVSFGRTSRKRRLDGIKFVPLEKFGGASQISIPPWPDSRALVREAGRVGRDYALRVAGAEPLAPRSNWSTSIHDR